MFKERIVKYISRYSYPQKEFALSIIRFIEKRAKGILIDVPCGNGVTSWYLSRLKNMQVYGYDISNTSIATAQNTFTKANLSFKVADIREVITLHKEASCFCIINSLFLLPEPETILKELKRELGDDSSLFIIVPNTESANFKWFQKNNPTVNKMVLSQSQVHSYFAACGWHLHTIKPIAYARTYGRKDSKLFSIFAPFYLRALNHIQSLLKLGTPNYFTLVLTKSK